MAVGACYVHPPCQPDCGTCVSGFAPEKGGMIGWEGRRKGERVTGKGSRGSEGGKTQATYKRIELPTFRAIPLPLSYIP